MAGGDKSWFPFGVKWLLILALRRQLFVSCQLPG